MNVAIVCNSLAGSGLSVELAEKAAAELARRSVPFAFFKNNWPGNFNDYTDVWICGGDGTLNYFINKYPNINIPLVILGGGTGNDVYSIFFKDKSFGEIIETALTVEPKKVDGGKCNDKYFINGVGIGFEGAVAKSLIGKKKKPGKAGFMGAIFRNIFFYTSKKYRVISDEYNGMKQHLLISVMNGHRAGGGFHIAPDSRIDDGLLDAVLVEKLHPFFRLRWLPVIEKGEHLGLSFITHFRTRKIIIASDTTIDAHLDGEYYAAKRLEIEILPEKYLFRY